jgi:hypothetical protein
MTGPRLRLTTSRKPSYRRGGVEIGSPASPTYLDRDSVPVGQLLQIVDDPNIVLAFEDPDGAIVVVDDEQRAAIAEALKQTIELDGPERTIFPAPDADQADLQPDTVEPQGGGSDPDAEASKVAGADASATASAGSAADAGTTEPTAQSDPPAPEPAPPVRAGGAKPKPVKAKP